MKRDEITAILPKDGRIYPFNAVINGKKKQIRLTFRCGEVYILRQGSRTQGYLLSANERESIEHLTLKTKADVDLCKRFIRRLKQSDKILSKSGLWPSIKQTIEHALSLPFEEIQQLVNDLASDEYNFYTLVHTEGSKYNWCNGCIEVFTAFIQPRCFSSLRISRKYMDADGLREQMRNAIQNKTKFSYRWHDGYDNSVYIDHVNGVSTAHYAEEYRGCGNGHYYILFDESHAVFMEDD